MSQTWQQRKWAHSFDYLISACEQRRWDIQVDALCSFEIHNKLEVSGLFERQIRRSGAEKDPNYEIAHPSASLRQVWSI